MNKYLDPVLFERCITDQIIILHIYMLLNIDIRGGKMTDKEKYEIIKKEIDELYIKQFEDERKQNFISELEAIKYTRKQDKEIKEFVEKRKKELGISTN